MFLYIFVHINIILSNYFKKKKEISIQICKLGNAMNASEACPWMLMRKCLLAMLILMLLNLNTGYADTDADLCIRIMSLCCRLSDIIQFQPGDSQGQRRLQHKAWKNRLNLNYWFIWFHLQTLTHSFPIHVIL